MRQIFSLWPTSTFALCRTIGRTINALPAPASSQACLITFAIKAAAGGTVNYARAFTSLWLPEEMRQRGSVCPTAADLGGHWLERDIHHSDT